jgi:hypothetical protein
MQKTVTTRPAFCPSCERFIGTAGVCPFCDADAARHPALRVLKGASLLLGVAGLACLYMMAAGRDVPVVRIGSVTPMMNFAYARVRGTVDREPYVSRHDGRPDYLSFFVDDGSGRLRVTAYRRVAGRLAGRDRVPLRGAVVDVAGSLRVGADGHVRLTVQAADALRIVAPAAGRSGEEAP